MTQVLLTKILVVMGLSLTAIGAVHAQKDPASDASPPTVGPAPLVPAAPDFFNEPFLVPIEPFPSSPNPSALPGLPPAGYPSMVGVRSEDLFPPNALSRWQNFIDAAQANQAYIGPGFAEMLLPSAFVEQFAPNSTLRQRYDELAGQGRTGVATGLSYHICGLYDVPDAQGLCGEPSSIATFELSDASGFFDHHYEQMLALRDQLDNTTPGYTDVFNDNLQEASDFFDAYEQLFFAFPVLIFPTQEEVSRRAAQINDIISRRYFERQDIENEELIITLVPQEGTITAEQLHRLDLSISGAEEGERFELTIEGRHDLFPDGDWGSADLRLIAPLEDQGCTYEATHEQLLCEPSDEGTASFIVDVPDSAVLHWHAVSQVDEERFEEGAIAIVPLATGQGVAVEEDESPQVLFVSPVSAQAGLDDQGDLVTRYPFGSGEHVSQGDRWRYLLVIGRNLPLTTSEMELSGSNEAIRYFFEESHESVAGRAFNGSHLDRGLQLYAEPGESSINVLNRLRDGEMDMVVVFAQLEEGVLPGPKSFMLNGQSVPWSLSFADTAAAFSFVRTSPDEVVSFEPVVESFGQEQLFVDLQLFPAELPYTTIPAMLTIEEGDTGATREQALTLRRAGSGHWRSQGLDLNQEGDGVGIDLEAGESGFSTLSVRIPTAFLADHMAFAVGAQAQMVLLPEPETTPWLEDLRTAARCTGYRFEDYPPEDLAFLEAAYEGGDPFSNIMVLNGFERMSQELRHGHLAGTLTLRRAYLRAASDEEERLRALLQDPALLASQIASWRRAFARIDADGPLSPLFKIDIPAAPLKGETSFGRILEFGHGYSVQLADAGLSDADILAWYLQAGQSVITRMVEGIALASRELRNTDPCDALALIKFAYGTDPIADMVIPTMMRQTSSGAWEPDVAARRWVRSTVGVARAYHEQVLASENDSDMASFALAVLTFPLIALQSGAITAVTTALDIADVGSNIVGTAQRYAASQAELAQSFGMSSVVGDGRYREALRRQVSAPAAAMQIGFGVIMVGFDGFQITTAMRASEGDRLMRQLADAPQVRVSPEGLDDLAALRDSLLERRALNGDLPADHRATLDRLLDGEFLDGALLHHRRAGPPQTPTGAAPDRPTRIAPSEEQIARAGQHGTSPEGIPRVLVLETDAPSTGVLDALDGSNQAALEAIDSDLGAIIDALPEGDIGSLVVTQARQILNDPDSIVGTVANLGNIGEGQFNNGLRLHYLIKLDPSAFASVRAHGITWETLAIMAHEAAHLVQSRFQQARGIIIGRALREFDASMVMVAAQNSAVTALGRGQSIGHRQALAFAFDYALDVQTKAWQAGGLGSRFSSSINYFDGLFQLNWSEALARARAYLPGVSERVVLEEFIRAQRASAAANGTVLQRSTIAGQNGVMNRWRRLISEAETRLAALSP